MPNCDGKAKPVLQLSSPSPPRSIMGPKSTLIVSGLGLVLGGQTTAIPFTLNRLPSGVQVRVRAMLVMAAIQEAYATKKVVTKGLVVVAPIVNLETQEAWGAVVHLRKELAVRPASPFSRPGKRWSEGSAYQSFAELICWLP